MAAALRLIPAQIKTIEELKLPPVLHDFAKLKQGFVLVVGPAGHGKSTTLAAVVDEINHQRTDHIITIEDPIEYLSFRTEPLFLNGRLVLTSRILTRDCVRFCVRIRMF